VVGGRINVEDRIKQSKQSFHLFQSESVMTREPSIYETRTNLSGGVIKGTRKQVIRHSILT